MSCLTPKLPGSTPSNDRDATYGPQEHRRTRTRGKTNLPSIASRHMQTHIVRLEAAKAERLEPYSLPLVQPPATWISHCFCRVHHSHPSLGMSEGEARPQQLPVQDRSTQSSSKEEEGFTEGRGHARLPNILKVSVSLILIFMIKPHRALNKS